MIFINNKQSNVDELLKIINEDKKTDYSRKSLSALFRKNPKYKINPITEMIDLGESKRHNNAVKKPVKGRDVLARFAFFSTHDGNHYEVRYTDVFPYVDPKSTKTVYKPKAIDLDGPIHTVSDADSKGFERMVYLFMHPQHSKSPLYTHGKVYKYTHLNNDEEFEQKAVQNNAVVSALQHAGTLSDVDIVIFAKSLNIPVQGLTPDQARTQLQSFLLAGGTNVDQYLKHMNDQSEVFIGRIIDAIDNKQIVSHQAGSSNIWSFDLADNKNQICVVPHGSDLREVLINHIKANIADYAPIIYGISRDNQKNLDYKQYFDKMDNPSTPAKILKDESDDIRVSEITEFSQAKLFWEYYFKRDTSSPKVVSPFFKAIQAGEITDDNLDETIQQFAPKS